MRLLRAVMQMWRDWHVVILRRGEAATKNLALMPFPRRDSSAPQARPQNDGLHGPAPLKLPVPIATLTLGLAAMLAAGGCATVSEGRFANPSAFSDTDAETAEEVARRILMELRFEPVVPAKSKGLIETQPVTGASWFEFWRKDTIGRVQVAESSLHTVRRRATVSISPKDAGSQVFVKVVKERAAAPGTMPNSFGHSFSKHNAQDTNLVRQDALEETHYEWVRMGRDPLLEQHILERIHLALQ